MLFPVALPSRGGDTQYVNMHEAYDDLPAATKERIDGLRAVHVYLRARSTMISAKSIVYPSFPRKREPRGRKVRTVAPCSGQGQALDPRFRGATIAAGFRRTRSPKSAG